MAPTCDQSFEGSKGESGPVVQYRAFGDSIPSGNKGSSSSRTSYGSYVNFFAADAAAANGWRVQYKTKTVAGETTPMINSTMNESAQKAMLGQADIITFNGGGNDFLDAQDAYKSTCDKAALVSAINNWKPAWDNVIATVRANAKSGAMIRTMTIYYPHPNADRSDLCNGEPVFDVLLPLGLAASHYMCATAEDQGWRCADALRAINCPTDDPRCPDMEWLNNLEAGVNTVGGNSCPRVNGGMMDHECIRDYLELTGDAAFVQDPSNTLLQGGDIHPNEAGHNAIADAHHALGYDDCTACPSQPAPPACGDGTCDAGENASVCPADCPDSCGDGYCTGSENASCSDCPSVCGDGLCTGNENASSCNGDCPTTCGDGYCTGSENASCSDCPAVCGDNLCTGSEDCNTCAGDCGECPAGTCNGIYYAASGTSSAAFTDVDTVQFDINMAAGTTYTISTCEGSQTDTWIRLHTASGSQLASNDDDSSCGTGRQSTITYTASSNGVRVLSLGCYGSNSCDATVSVSPDAACVSEDNGGGSPGGECAETSSCGGQAPSGCWCDSACVNYGDCCSEVEADCQ